jgi:hypothetical protein
MRNKKALFGIYPSVAHAERAVNSLIGERFFDTDVSVLLPDNRGARDFAYGTHTKAPEGTTTGVATSGTIGHTFGVDRTSVISWPTPPRTILSLDSATGPRCCSNSPSTA